MMDVIVNIMTEVLTILAIATKEIKQRRASELIPANSSHLTHRYIEKYMKKLLGKDDIESALKRLDTLTQEEGRMATVEVLKMMRGVDDKVNVVLDGAQWAVIQVIHPVSNIHISRWKTNKRGHSTECEQYECDHATHRTDSKLCR